MKITDEHVRAWLAAFRASDMALEWEDRVKIGLEAALTMESEAPHGWVCWNDGPGAWFWSKDRAPLEHELSDDIRPATALEQHFMLWCGGSFTPNHSDLKEDTS